MAAIQTAGPSLRILVAEDEALAAMVIAEALTELGHVVLLAEDGERALEIAGREPFDVLVTDLAMPHLPGWELIPRLRAQRPGLPVVVMTGYLPPGIGPMLRADAKAPVTVLLKPFDLSALTEALARVAPASQACDAA